MLRSGALNESTSELALKKIERNAEVQQNLIDDLLDVSRIVTGKFRVDPHPINLVSVIEDGIDLVASEAQARKIQLHVTLERKGIQAHGDANRLRQLIWNLLSNAIKFTPEGGSVRIDLTSIDREAQITVSDTGCGISAEVLPYIFERFRQGESARQLGGLGLGLAIVRHIAEMHGGTVEAASKGEGQGASFTVKLPLIAEERLDILPEVVEADQALKFQVSGS